jgi:hypothetical protein
MDRRYGDLKENILRAGEDHVLGDNQLDALHEHSVQLATLAKSTMPFAKEDVVKWAKIAIGGMKCPRRKGHYPTLGEMDGETISIIISKC